eukprot:CAMPEP_0172459582 /NCGR_PEP_ID=MMETSP1065-20121228/33262_1 /TAXON_ID=265537 /ORGANISM="Amphiprora paludosa, Strain CCMP125" /LENGTH=463 /DNA_ID=CAMNT_0013214319 /DNA_START=214 /DNA_END=1604 /DNA_ORIENTATION=+
MIGQERFLQNKEPPFLYAAGATATTTTRNDNDGTATIPNEVFNLVKSMIGAGVLSLPAGVAAFGNAPRALLPACLLMALMGLLSAYTFSLMARVCRLTGAATYAQAWEWAHQTKESIDKNQKNRGTTGSSFLISAKFGAACVALSSALDCWAGNLTYSMVLADTVRDLVAGLGGVVWTRSQALVSLTTVVLLPLCLVRNLSSLAPFSLVGILGMVYTGGVIGYRYFTGAYGAGGALAAQLTSAASRPSFGTVGASGVWTPQSLILISMLSTAYICHFNAPKFYRELRNNTLPRFHTVVGSSFGIAIAFYSLVTSWSFLTFGAATKPMILSNYATTDALVSVARFAVGLSLIFSYPLLFVGTREGLYDLCQVSLAQRQQPWIHIGSTVGLLGLITAMAVQVTDLTLVASLSGALLGTSLIFIFPTLMFRAVSTPSTNKWERRLCSVICGLGVAIAGVGAKMALQ